MENNTLDFVKNEGIDVDGLDTEETVNEAVDENEQDVTETVEETVDDISEVLDSRDESVSPPPMTLPTAFVTGCLRLNVRKAPSKESEVLEVVNVNDELVIGSNLENEEWVSVETPSGVLGYCMKSFLAVNAEQ